MRHLNGVYTQGFNRRHHIDGQLFRGRYRAVLIDADSYLLEVLRYIHRNPLRATVATTLGDYPWSSHKGYVCGARKWDWLYRRKPQGGGETFWFRQLQHGKQCGEADKGAQQARPFCAQPAWQARKETQ
jgi:hypothetical protein